MTDKMNNGEMTAPLDSSAFEVEIRRALEERDRAVADVRRQGPPTTEEAAFQEGLRAEWLAGPASRRWLVLRPVRRVLAPMAAAAAVLVGVWLGGGLPGTGADGSPVQPEVQGPGARYLGDQVDGEQVFGGTVDWSGSPIAQSPCKLAIVDADPTLVGEASIVLSVDYTEGPTWTCPPDVLDQLPPRFRVEVYDLAEPVGLPPGWSALYRRP